MAKSSITIDSRLLEFVHFSLVLRNSFLGYALQSALLEFDSGVATEMIGSIWRKWDLHLHAPGTAKNNQYGDVDLDLFCQTLIELDLAAVGITDYFSVDLAFRVKETLQKLQKGSSIQVFPNLELRDSKAPSRSRLNFHVVFSNHLSEEQVKLALSRVPVQLPDGGSNYLSDLTSGEIEHALADISEVSKALTNSFNNESPFLIVTASGSDGYRPKGNLKDWSPMAVTESNLIIRASHAIFGNKKDANYWKEPTEFDKKPRPVFSGSDAHKLDDLIAYHKENESTWIKGEVSFAGLQETLIEPSSRVRIQKLCPEDKDASRVIESITISYTGEEKRKKFDQTIHLNPALNSIIGARSSGKSILAALIAYAWNPARTIKAQQRVSPLTPKGGRVNLEKQFGPAGSWSWDEFSREVEVSLKWRNGEVSTPSNGCGNLTYLPQGYLNSLAEDQDEIQLLLEKALEDQPANKTLEKFQSVQCALDNAKHEIRTLVQQIFDDKDQISKLLDTASTLGDLDSLEERKLSLGEKQALLTGSNLIESDKDILNEYLDTNRMVASWSPVDLDNGKASLMRSVDSLKRPKLGSEVEKSVGSLLDRIWKESMQSYQEQAENILLVHSDADASALLQTASLRDDLAERLKSSNGGVLPSQESEEAKAVSVELEQVSKNIAKLRLANSELIELQSGFEKQISQVEDLRKGYFDLVEELQQSQSRVGTKIDAIQVGIDFGIDNENLPAIDFVNKNKGVPVWAEYDEFLEDLDGNGSLEFSNFRELFIAVVESKLEIRSGSDGKRLGLAADIACLLPIPRLFGTFDNDRFGGFERSGMSAGKRALAGLTLLLSDESNIGPLVVDQPEDDLDSRSITEAIVPYLRNAKTKRQVVIVSHNANLVVGADSELVLVANQGSKSYKNYEGLRYFYGAGALESSAENAQSGFYFQKQSVKSHICDLLDGGLESFEKRARRYQ